MPRIHIAHPDVLLSRFLADYLSIKGFQVTVSNSHVHAYTMCAKDPPHLILMTKEAPLLDAVGFIIKKEHTRVIEEVPVFLMGDFKPKEIEYFKKHQIEAFLSMRINPAALAERLYQFFRVPLPSPQRRTPMLMDIHAKGNLLIVQLEGNLEPDKTSELQYLIARFIDQKAIRTPRIMFIIPSMYPDLINTENVRRLFSFLQLPNIKPKPDKIVVLSKVKAFLSVLDSIPELKEVQRVADYYEGYRSLIADFNVKTSVPTVALKPDSRFFLDLYAPDGSVLVKAMQEVGQATLDLLASSGIQSLTYYGDPSADRINADDYNPQETSLFEYITKDFTPVAAELFDNDLLSEKQNLFFSRMRGKHLLFVSLDPGLYLLVQQALSVYFEIENVRAGENLRPMLEDPKYVVMFVDLAIPKDTVFKMLHTIRSTASRRKTTIVLLARTLNKDDLVAYRSSGTDHVILAPFTTDKIFNKVYSAMTLDRGA